MPALHIFCRLPYAELTCELDAPLYERIDAPATPEPFLSSFCRRTSGPPSLPVTLSRLRSRGREKWRAYLGTSLAKMTFAQLLTSPLQPCPRVCGGFEIHYDPVEWNYGPADHERLYVKG